MFHVIWVALIRLIVACPTLSATVDLKITMTESSSEAVPVNEGGSDSSMEQSIFFPP